MSLPNIFNAIGADSQSKRMSISSLTSPTDSITRYPSETKMDTASSTITERSPNTPNIPYLLSISHSPNNMNMNMNMNMQHATQQNYKANEHYFQQHQQQQQQYGHTPYHQDEQNPNQHHPYQQRDMDSAAAAATPYSVNINTNINQYNCKRTNRSSSTSSAASVTAPAPPLTTEQRRARNKAASAKYRLKKNRQQGDMESRIASMSMQNDILKGQLEQLGRENAILRKTCDNLRGKMMAEKMIQKLLNNKALQVLVSDVDDEDDENDQHACYKSVNSRYNGDNIGAFQSETIRPNTKRYDEDIDFEDDDDNDDNNEHYDAYIGDNF